ncbi:zf-TFIIB domain-containing protein [Paenibacillus sp. J2TS4]|uniref:TFIIB-type zinc ribbon-containing protein n=1 Tax=Paenibacillus sp. J2TS4 TaxID=2807194 RepID=UPI001AFCFE13|nr:zf-TFIIB domain-containing protein [Paenibacillus sp. J2TS4]GIP35700.1 hypothetical protein J2TS4_49100 [Paenibacillus sp. J2TS4]
MKCPVCNDVRMREVTKDGVLIDVCPDCKGVWLDRGELEKLMKGVHELKEEYDYSYRERNEPREFARQDDYGDLDERRSYRESYPSKDDHHYPKHKRKKKRNVFDIFEDLFD